MQSPSQIGMTPLHINIQRVSLMMMRNIPLLRAQSYDVRSPAAVSVC